MIRLVKAVQPFKVGCHSLPFLEIGLPKPPVRRFLLRLERSRTAVDIGSCRARWIQMPELLWEFASCGVYNAAVGPANQPVHLVCVKR